MPKFHIFHSARTQQLVAQRPPFAMLGDINISEPGALIGFAGPRVVRDTTGKELPDDFQTAEFLQEHGFLDFIAHRSELKEKVNLYLDLILNDKIR